MGELAGFSVITQESHPSFRSGERNHKRCLSNKMMVKQKNKPKARDRTDEKNS